jgi:hypothetical protein
VSGGVPRPQQWLIGARRCSRYGAPFFMRFNPTDAAHKGNTPRGSSNGGVTKVGRATAVGLLQPSVTSTTGSNGRPMTRLGYAGATRHVEGQHGVGSAQRGL